MARIARVQGLLSACLLLGVLCSVAAAETVSSSMMTRTLLQADDAKCENKYNRVADDEFETPCCFPVKNTVTGEMEDDCFAGTDDLVYCATELSGSAVVCKPQNTGVRDLSSSSSSDTSGDSSEESVLEEEAKAEMRDALEGTTEDTSDSEHLDEALEKLKVAFAPGPAPATAERYTVNDQPCKFPTTGPDGEEVNDCFAMQEEYEAFELDANTQREYCYEEGGDGKPELCVARGYIPGQEMPKPDGLCPDATTVTTIGGKTCSFPQVNTRTKNWECGCYTIHNDADSASYDDEVKYYCMPDGESDGEPEQCPEDSPIADGSTATTEEDSEDSEGESEPEPAVGSSDQDGESESEDGSSADDSAEEQTDVESTSQEQEVEPWGDGGDSSDNSLAIGLGVGIPLAVITVGAIAGGAFWWFKKRPEAKAAKFNKFEGDNPIRGGAVSSKDVEKTGEGLSAVSKFAEV